MLAVFLIRLAGCIHIKETDHIYIQRRDKFRFIGPKWLPRKNENVAAHTHTQKI